jgi:hypothetical protein
MHPQLTITQLTSKTTLFNRANCPQKLAANTPENQTDWTNKILHLAIRGFSGLGGSWLPAWAVARGCGCKPEMFLV